MTEAQPTTDPQAWWLAVARGAEYAELVKRRPRGGVVRPAIKPEGAAWYVEVLEGFAGLGVPGTRDNPGEAARTWAPSPSPLQPTLTGGDESAMNPAGAPTQRECVCV